MNVIIELFKVRRIKVYLNKIFKNNFFKIKLFLNKKNLILIIFNNIIKMFTFNI